MNLIHDIWDKIIEHYCPTYNVRIIDFGDRMIEDNYHLPIYIPLNSYTFVGDKDMAITQIIKWVDNKIDEIKSEYSIKEVGDIFYKACNPKIIFKDINENNGAISFKLGVCIN